MPGLVLLHSPKFALNATVSRSPKRDLKEETIVATHFSTSIQAQSVLPPVTYLESGARRRLVGKEQTAGEGLRASELSSYKYIMVKRTHK